MIRHKARELFLGIYCKFREKVKDYLERYDMAKRYWVRVDPDYKQAEELFAKQLLWQSGLNRETPTSFQEALENVQRQRSL